jgi:hypothetical protein
MIAAANKNIKTMSKVAPVTVERSKRDGHSHLAKILD